MDIVNHAIAGASVGAAFGHPVLGAVCALLPDAVLPVKRVYVVTPAYTASHSLLACGAVGGVLCLLFNSAVPLLALLSHLLLDIPTHSKRWAPALFYPVSNWRCSLGRDWEFFSLSWWIGLTVTFIWSTAWLTFAL